MTFSIQNYPYFPMYPPLPYTSPDSTLNPKSMAFGQTLSPRLHGSYGIELLNSLLASYVSSTLPHQDAASIPQKWPHPPLAPFFSPSGWFHQVLTSSLQTGTLQLPRQLPEDLSMPMSSRASDLGFCMSPRELRRPPVSPVAFKRKLSLDKSATMKSDKDRFDPLLYYQPTFYPILKDRVEKAHQSWRTSDAFRFPNNSLINETGTLVPSLIDGEIIMGFNVWGEKRLCLPHLFRFVLNDVDLKAIDEACTKLQITCTTCSPAQLTLLHSRKILPQAVSSCGLIRKSDAERLTKFIRNRVSSDHYPSLTDNRETRYRLSSRTEPTADDVTSGSASAETTHDRSAKRRRSSFSSLGNGDSQPLGGADEDFVTSSDNTKERQPLSASSEPIPVIHECFGRQLGLVYPDLYVEASSKCLECRTCHRMFAPDQFVGHTHTVTEVANLNHWGFDSTNWRCYLRLYTGRRSCSELSRRHESQRSETSDDETDGADRSVFSCTSVQAHRRLEEFKVKFAQPIRLPGSLSAALRTVGLCASVAPIPSTVLPDATSASGDVSRLRSPSSSLPKPTVSKESSFPPVFGSVNTTSVSPNASPPSTVMLPQLTLRRLWAPNDGRIKVPPAPKPAHPRDLDILPKRLHTGPPLLLHSSRVVSQAAADRFDRDFIPNVCLMPPLKLKSGGISARSRQLSQCCQGKVRYFKGTRVFCDDRESRSRSISRRSSGSSSSRTRSASMSSASSSSCSYDEHTRHYYSGRVPPTVYHKTQRSPSASSTFSVRVDDDPKQSQAFTMALSPKSRSHSWTTHNRLRSVFYRSESAHSDSVVSIYCRQLSEVRRRRCRSLTVPFHPAGSESSKRVRQAPSLQSELRESKPSEPPARLKRFFKHFSERSHLSRRRHKRSGSVVHAYGDVRKRQHRAMAAAKAAQGAASRICPGLWSRYFANFGSSNNGPLDLPNAREPHSVSVVDGSHPAVNAHNHSSGTPVLVTNPAKNSLPTAVLALEAIWADLVRHINEYTVAVESRCGVGDARQRLFEQFITMQTCYATHIATLMNENQKLNEQLTGLRKRQLSESTYVPPETSRMTTHQASENDLTPVACGTSSRTSSDGFLVQGTTASRFCSNQLYPHRSRKKFMRGSRSGSECNITKRLSDSRRASDLGGSHPMDCCSTNRRALISSPSHSKGLVGSSSPYQQSVVGLNCPIRSSEATSRTPATHAASKTDGYIQEHNLGTEDHPVDNSISQLRDIHSSCIYSFSPGSIATISNEQPEGGGTRRRRQVGDTGGHSEAPPVSPESILPPSAKRHQPFCDPRSRLPLQTYAHLLGRF